jgi:integrase
MKKNESAKKDAKKRPKRKNGEGSITTRADGRIMVRYCNPESKKPIVAYCKTELEAEIKLHDIKKDVQKGVYVNPSSITLTDWIKKWLPITRRVKELSVNEYLHKQDLLRTHIKPSAIGRISLQKLKPMDIDLFYADLLENGKEKKEKDEYGNEVIHHVGLAAQTVKHIHNIIKPALQYAEDNGLVHKSPAKKILPPKVKHKEAITLKEKEVAKYLAVLAHRRRYALFVLELCTGLRRGELLGLQWQDLDFETRTLYIRRQLIRVRSINGLGSSLEYKVPKSVKSTRNIILPLCAISELTAHKARQDEGLIFPTALGKKTDPRRIYETHCQALKAAKIKHIAFHNLRHTVATLLLLKGENFKTIQELLGHSDIRTTMDTYVHVLDEMKAASAETMNGIISEALTRINPDSSLIIPD